MESLYVNKPIYPILSLLSSFIIFFIGLLVSKEIALAYLLLALTLIYLFYGYGKVLLKAIPIFVVIGAIIGAGATITSRNYVTGIQTAGRILLLVYSSVTMIALPPINLTRNLMQLKVPRVLTLGMLATVRFVPILVNEAKQIREAMKTRGANVNRHNLPLACRAFLVPFVMRILNISEVMAVSVETRGFVMTDKPTTVYKEVRFTLRDALFALLLTITIMGVILVWIK